MKIIRFIRILLFSFLKKLHQSCLALVLGCTLGLGFEIKKIDYLKKDFIESKK